MTSSRTDPQPPRWRLAPVRRRVNLSWVALGLLLVVGLGVAGVVVIDRIDQRQGVLAVARPVPAGQLIQPLDLTTVQITPTQGLAVLPATARAQVVGRPAAIRLTPGMLLAPEAVGPPSGLAGGEALVAVALDPGGYPPELTAGATVQVVATANPEQPTGAASAGPGRVLVSQATVLAIHAQPQQTGQASVVTVKVPIGTVGSVAAAGAAGRVALVLVAPPGGT